MVENIVGTGPLTGVDGAETTISLSWVIERGKREQRIAFANAGVSVVDTKRRILQLDVATETARRFLDCLRLENKLEQANEARSLHRQSASCRPPAPAGIAIPGAAAAGP